MQPKTGDPKIANVVDEFTILLFLDIILEKAHFNQFYNYIYYFAHFLKLDDTTTKLNEILKVIHDLQVFIIPIIIQG